MKILGFSGGKDSTAAALGLAERGEDFKLLFTPTGDELPLLWAHIERVAQLIDRELVVLKAEHDLYSYIDVYNTLPSVRSRWCTRILKIVPCIAYLKRHPGSTLLVGLRADEEERVGLYGPYATYRYPLREWGWGVQEVLGYIRSKGLKVPARTDCALCPYQSAREWWQLWRDYPERYARGEALEARTGHTFRSPTGKHGRWAASLAGMRTQFEAGMLPRGAGQPGLLDGEEEICRVCRL